MLHLVLKIQILSFLHRKLSCFYHHELGSASSHLHTFDFSLVLLPKDHLSSSSTFWSIITTLLTFLSLRNSLSLLEISHWIVSFSHIMPPGQQLPRWAYAFSFSYHFMVLLKSDFGSLIQTPCALYSWIKLIIHKISDVWYTWEIAGELSCPDPGLYLSHCLWRS